ncbi:ATP-binding protein [Streptomyces mexicanus]|jgi:anti-sigma regulatory factor (Ser/Thr protein kinase)|uniref:ATP-binding protein n=1 Tax=Streptomyces mexicanus TaxID=178566 RepID=A0A7X1HUY5_9ACTN|nr:ATP-binding protein [Streptomyces mexicanus]MBC2863476.1 ATP-binding protein [Streptomyces mexicanus]
MGTVSLPDTWVYALRLPHDPRAARVARMTVRAALGSHGRHELVEVVELLVSELVTNAYRHTRGPASLRLTALADGRLRVGVWDSHPRIPAPFGEPPWDRVAPAPADADGGRGLRLVQEYADCWGSWPLRSGPLDRGAGKLLWFEVGGRGEDAYSCAYLPSVAGSRASR